MKRTLSHIKHWLTLMVILSLGVAITACGSTSKSSGSNAQTPSGGAETVAVTTSASKQPEIRPGAAEYIKYLKSVGKAAGEPDKREITALVKRFYAYAAADDGVAACTLYTKPLQIAIPEDYGNEPARPHWRGKTCAIVMTKLFKRPPEVSVAELAKTKVVGVRVNGNVGLPSYIRSACPSEKWP